DLLFELARSARIEREMTGIVRTRRELVDEEAPVARHEELDAKDADVIERVHDAPSRIDRERSSRRRDVGRRDRNVEDVAAMCVFDWTEMRPAAADAARANHRDLAIEIDERFEDGFAAAERFPRLSQRVR